VIVETPGTGSGNAPPNNITEADWLISNGTTWLHFAMHFELVAAGNVGVTPIPGLPGVFDVQAALAALRARDDLYLLLTGGSLSGGLGFGARTGSSNTDLTQHILLHTAGYGFSITGGRLNVVSGGTTVFVNGGGDRLTIAAGAITAQVPLSLSADPTVAMHAATKQYVDAAISPIDGGTFP